MKRVAKSLALADRYAKALLSVALDKKADADRIAAELEGVTTLLSSHPQLAEVLASSTIPAVKRVGVLEKIVRKQELTPYALNVLNLLTRKDRIAILEDVSRRFTRLVMEHKGIQAGEVVSAQPLTEEQRARLAQSLGKALEKTMELSFQTDSELVGGLVVRIGNRVYDASVAAQLRQFRERALAGL